MRWKIGLMSLALAGCGGSTGTPPASVTPASADAVGPNTLTAAEQSAGWRLLFDGKTTQGWRGYKQPTMPAG